MVKGGDVVSVQVILILPLQEKQLAPIAVLALTVIILGVVPLIVHQLPQRHVVMDIILVIRHVKHVKQELLVKGEPVLTVREPP